MGERGGSGGASDEPPEMPIGGSGGVVGDDGLGGQPAPTGGGGGQPDREPTPDAASPAENADAGVPDKPKPTSSLMNEKLLWNGDGVGSGNGTQWMGRGQEGKTTLGYSSEQGFSPTHSVKFTMANINYGEFGWGVTPVPANQFKKIAFWTNMVRQPGKTAPGNALVTLKVGGGYAAPGGGRGVETIKYNKTALQGGWQQIVIPIADIVGNPGGATITEILVGFTGCGSANCSFSFYMDDIAVGN